MSGKATTVGEALSDLAAGSVEAPAAERASLAVPLSEIPLPPEGLVDQLDNAPDGAGAAPEGKVEVATLDFCGDVLPEFTRTLTYPFRLHGERVEAITVRQLRTFDIGEVYAEAAREKRTVQLYDFYARMTGYPAPVLRALPAVDGEPIIDKAYDFLPPSLRPASG